MESENEKLFSTLMEKLNTNQKAEIYTPQILVKTTNIETSLFRLENIFENNVTDKDKINLAYKFFNDEVLQFYIQNYSIHDDWRSLKNKLKENILQCK